MEKSKYKPLLKYRENSISVYGSTYYCTKKMICARNKKTSLLNQDSLKIVMYMRVNV